MDGSVAGRRVGCKRARTKAGAIAKRALLMLMLAGPHVLSSEALKLASISEDRGHLGVGLLRAVEVVRGRYERAWALVSAPEPSAEDLDTALELLQANAKQWESLEPAVKLWAERDSDAPLDSNGGGGSSDAQQSSDQQNRSAAAAAGTPSGSGGSSNSSNKEQQQQDDRSRGAPGASDTTSRIYEEAASLLALNRAVLGQALARSGQTDRGIAELEVACPEILEHQQNAQGRRDSKGWLHCYSNLAEMYKTQKRFEEATSLLARMPWLPSPQATAAGNDHANSSESPATATAEGGTEGGVSAARLDSGTGDTSAGHLSDSSESSGAAEGGTNGEGVETESAPPGGGVEDTLTSGASGSGAAAADAATGSTPSKGAAGGGRSEAPPPSRGAGAARVAGLNKAAAAAAAAAMESATAAAGAVETGAEAAARAVVERHAEAMRASMNEIVGELAVTTATRPTASQEWLDSRVTAAEEVLAAVRSGLLAVAATPEQAAGGMGTASDTFADVPAMAVGALGHADILREASHYLSAIKGVAAQGWTYVDNEIHRMERHPAQPVKPGFQSRREVIHTFRYLLMKARQYASENQNQNHASRSTSRTSSTADSGSGSHWRRKDSRGRKASASSKAPRKGSAARGRSSRSDPGSSPNDSDGVMTLLIGAGIAVLVAAVSSGGGRGQQGRRRQVVRQRTATRAAKTVGSYVEPPQRSAVAALLLQAWGNLRRSGLTVSSHAMSTAHLARALLLTSWASLLEKTRTFRVSTKAVGRIAGRKTPVASPKKDVGAAPGGSKQQRSRKNAKKVTPATALPRLLVRGDTAGVTPPTSPQARSQPEIRHVGPHRPAAAPLEASGPSTATAAPSEGKAVVAAATAAAAVPASKMAGTATTALGTSDVTAPSWGAADARSIVPPPPLAEMQTAGSGDRTIGMPFSSVMTVAQVQAMVEEDERAWEQARLSDRSHSNAGATGSAASTPVAEERTDVAAAQDVADAGWSEVGGSGSRGRASGGAGGRGRGRLLSLRNVRAAAAQAAAGRTSSPGSDPATTTSASSSDSGEGFKETPSRGEGRATMRAGGGVARESARGSATAGQSKSTWGAAPPQSRTAAAARPQPQQQHTSRGSTQTREAPPAREPEQVLTRPVRASTAPWATTRNSAPAAAKMLQVGGKLGGTSKSARTVAESSPAVRKEAPWVDVPQAATVDRSQIASPQRQTLQPETPATPGDQEEVGGDEAEVVKTQPAPVAWTNTPAHPLGMKPELAPHPPASAPPLPPPQHQQHWQRQQHREQIQQRQQQQQQQQQQQRFFQQEQHIMPMSAGPMQLHQDAGNHHYPPLPPLPHPHNHHHQQQQQQRHPPPLPPPPPPPLPQHHDAMPHLIPASDEAYPPPSACMPVAAANGIRPHAPAMIYPANHMGHPANIIALPSPGVSPGGGLAASGGNPHIHVRDGSYDSPGSAGTGFSPDTAAPMAHLHAIVLPPPYDQQVGDHFSPPAPHVVPIGDMGCGMTSPVYEQHAPGGAPVGYPSPIAIANGSPGGVEGEALDALMGALRWQVEYYFSADNLVRDAYLRGLMDPEGFVPVSKIMVFNRVRRMTNDSSLLIAAMRCSSELEIREQDHAGDTRVRTRHSPLHWTQEQLPPSKAPPPPISQEQGAETRRAEAEESEDEEPLITFGDVAEVIDQDEPPTLASSAAVDVSGKE